MRPNKNMALQMMGSSLWNRKIKLKAKCDLPSVIVEPQKTTNET